MSCVEPVGFASVDGDCDDTDLSVHPAAAEAADGVDSDCDGLDVPCPVDPIGVPGDYPTIQGAIDAACDGSTIEVAGGTWVETIDLGTKTLWVTGLAGSAGTTIDGDLSGDPVVTLAAGGVEGFTVTNGLAVDGGGVYVARSVGVELTDLRVTGNVAASDGGGLYAADAEDLTVTDCSFDTNEAGSDGGGVYLQGGSVQMVDSEISGNTAPGYGGGIAGESTGGSSGHPTTFTEVSVTDNVMACCSGWGGGAYLNGSFEWTGGEVSGNSSEYRGGLLARGSFVISDIDISGNSAGSYSAFDGSGSGASSVDGMRVTDNVSTWGIVAWFSAITVTDLTVTDSVAGGEILWVRSGSLDGLEMRGNDAGSNALLTSDGSDASISNVVIAGNTGYGMSLRPSSTTTYAYSVLNSTVTGNTGDGIYVTPSWVNQVDIRNVIVTGNGGRGVVDTSSVYQLTLQYNDVYGNVGAGYSGMTDPTGTNGNVSVDPGFVSCA